MMKADKIIVHTPQEDMPLSRLLNGIVYCRSNPKFEELTKRYALTELGAGYLFADSYKDIARYVPERNKWYIFKKIWQPDAGKLMELCKELANAVIEYEPQSVKDATDEYRQDSDKVGLFLTEMMVKDPQGLTPTTEAYGEYRHWCYENGYMVENMSTFKKCLGPHAEIKRKRPGGLGRSENPVWCICGYRLRDPVNVPLTCENPTEDTQEAEEGA